MISIIYENAFFTVLNKPEGISTHNEKSSLSDWLIQNKKSTHFVNRLDTLTSGLIIIANLPEYQEPLRLALDQGTKTYQAVLRGPWKTSERLAIWKAPLTDKAEGRKNPQGLAKDRKPCYTEVHVKRTNQYFTEVLCNIKTGRQHQIRKHAALAKHPLIGDPRYNDDQYNKRISSIYKTERMFLNAYSLSFVFKNESHYFETQNMESDLFFK